MDNSNEKNQEIEKKKEKKPISYFKLFLVVLAANLLSSILSPYLMSIVAHLMVNFR